MKKDKRITMLASVGLNPMRRIDWHMMVNLRVAMYSETGLHAKTIANLVNGEFGSDLSVGQIHTRNKKRDRKLRDARDGDTPYMEMQIRAIKSWPENRIKRIANIPLQIQGEMNNAREQAVKDAKAG